MFWYLFLAFQSGLIIGIIMALYGITSHRVFQPIRSSPSEIHVEAVLNDEIFEKLKVWAKNHTSSMLLLYVAKDWENKITLINLIKERYLELSKLGNPIGLHVHVAAPCRLNIDMIPYKEQYEVIKFGVDFLSFLNIPLVDFAPGWWSYNKDTVKACVALGLNRFHIGYKTDHAPRELGAEVILVKNYTHDWNLVGS